MVNCVRRAFVCFFCAAAIRYLHIEVPAVAVHGPNDQLGKLRLSLYLKTDAACTWQETFPSHLVGRGFTRGRGYPCVFMHSKMAIWCMVHGDDYVRAGYGDDPALFESQLSE